MKREIIFIVFFSLFLISFSNETLKISSIEYPPISYMKDSQASRIFVDLVKESFDAVNVDVKYEFIPISRAVWSVVENKYNVLKIGL